MIRLTVTVHRGLFGPTADEWTRRLTLIAAMVGFLGHLTLWILHEFGTIQVPSEAHKLLNSPLAALYTPFSILLTYEVYQLIKAIPESFSTAVGKQFEVATLLVVRDVFKRLSNIQFEGEWTLSGELGLVVVECITFLIMLVAALMYENGVPSSNVDDWKQDELDSFVTGKKFIAVLLLFMFLAIGLMSITGWLMSVNAGEVSVKRDIFFLDFFTCLILADIFILLISYRHSHDFYALVRNTGFVLSTVILRVAISAPGLSSMALFAISGVLGILVLRVTRYFRRRDVSAPTAR
ncbi:MAG: hypothetical protein VX589_16850 [Myxococcota bacterium]|nr:hypothetical protein [Myxococcota bacterium]